ncbi:MAG: aminotransferase class III-fold pyridoxal phosphate-dependent enzyme [Gammaproteobacteria bacterium]|nr:aminotransferase class III-fold pyridoxal phosphate-dependent enzyme [Gammaproteobacteria bacterium]MCZ6853037.1 aminotransferase class III-fold pyridoxal phosphate-dependent enzyme [Gammaproteobacteria bacterium]
MFPNLESTSAALNARARKSLAGGGSRSTIRTNPYTLYIRDAQGAEVVDVDGNHLLDFINNYTSLIHGHSYPPIVEAVRGQLPRGSAFSFCHESEIDLAELLCERVPSFERVRFMNSGSEAVMNAIKLARAFTGRPKIAKCDGFYHGSYDFAEVSLSSGPEHWLQEDPPSLAYSRGTPQSVLDEVVVIPFNEPQHSQRILERHAQTLSCIVVDTTCMRLGGNLVREDYVTMLKDISRRNGILLVYDEVVSFRLGYSGSQGVLGVIPDVTALGKIIGGGFPVGAVAGRADVMSMFDSPADGVAPLPHGGTFNANPITMSAGLAAMKDMTPDAFESLNLMGGKAREAMTNVFTESGVIGQVTGVGSFFKLHLHDRPITTVQDAGVSSEGQQQLATLRANLIDAGIFLGSGCFGCLSTATTDTHIERLCTALAGALRKIDG